MTMYFKLKRKAGNHSQKDKNGKAVVYVAKDGNVIESENDLIKMFPGKFELVEVVTAPVEVVKSAENKKSDVQKIVEKVAKDISAPVKKEEKKAEPIGKDVTEKHPLAEEQDFKVFYVKGKGYFVTEADDDSVALNKKGIKKEKVEAFIKKYLEG